MPKNKDYAPASTTAGDHDDTQRQVESFQDEEIDAASGANPSLNLKSVRGRMLERHDSLFSVTSDYEDPSDNDLNIWQGAALLTADCMGTGLLALPEDVQVLGRWLGLTFLILNLPINLYAGTILSNAAGHVEQSQRQEDEIFKARQDEALHQIEEHEEDADVNSKDGLMIDSPKNDRGNHRKEYSSVATDHSEEGNKSNSDHDDVHLDQTPQPEIDPHQAVHHDTATFDFIGMTQALFASRRASQWAMLLFYTNIFLVLGDYILVMSHAVSALVGEKELCIPEAGILASSLMFAVSQTRTMAKLGRAASIISLSALAVVVLQCLVAVHNNPDQDYSQASATDYVETSPSFRLNLLRKFSALGSIGFAVGSQKLFLNIRHELADRSQAPKSLAVSLSVFGCVYTGIILLAGSDPPGFLFDAIDAGWNRRLAGFLLWIHVVVSYAINSQAICSSMDRLFFSSVEALELNKRPKIRWMILTGFMAIMAFLVSNAVPFFKDLVAFIGALTSVPLTLLLPAIFYRRVKQVSIWCPTGESILSYGLLCFAVAFMVCAIAGSVSSIESDWSGHGVPFACH